MNRPMDPSSYKYTGNDTSADQIARQFAGTEQPGITPLAYSSSPGQCEMGQGTAHPDGGWAWNADAPQPSALGTYRTW